MWTPEQPTSQLSELIQPYFHDYARSLLKELRENRLVVILIQGDPWFDNSRMIRAVVSRNPEWYRCLYSRIPHFRRDRSEKSLERISNGTDRPLRQGRIPFYNSYDFLYRELILDNLLHGESFQGESTPPVLEVCEYFGVPENVKRHYEGHVPY